MKKLSKTQKFRLLLVTFTPTLAVWFVFSFIGAVTFMDASLFDLRNWAEVWRFILAGVTVASVGVMAVIYEDLKT